MILTGAEIQRELNLGEITISPFEPSLINPNSYNYRLGATIVEVSSVSHPQGISRQIPQNGFVLEAGKYYLAATYEEIGSDKYVMSLIGRSSIGRLGLFLQISADLGHQGSIHRWTLELRPTVSIRIYPMMKIGQVSFWLPTGPRTHTKKHFANFSSEALGRIEF